MVEIDTLFQTKTAEKDIPFGEAHTHIAYIRDSPGAKNVLQIMSLTAYTSRYLILLYMHDCTLKYIYQFWKEWQVNFMCCQFERQAEAVVTQ